MTLQKLGNGNSDAISLDDDFAPRHRPIIGHDEDRVVLLRVQLDHCAAAHPQKLMHGNDRAAEHDGDLDLDAYDIGGHELLSRVKSPILSPLWFPRG